MSIDRLTEVLSQHIGRRKLLRRASQAAMVLTAGLASMSNRVVEAAGCCTPCNYTTSRQTACCNLGFPNNCSDLSCFDNNHTWWAWGCTSNGISFTCYECCDYQCSLAFNNNHRPQLSHS